MSQIEVINHKLSRLIKKAKAAHSLNTKDLAFLTKIPVAVVKKTENYPCFVQARLLYRLILILGLEEYGFYLTTQYGLKKFLDQEI